MAENGAWMSDGARCVAKVITDLEARLAMSEAARADLAVAIVEARRNIGESQAAVFDGDVMAAEGILARAGAGTVLREHDAKVREAERGEWAEYLEQLDGMVGAPQLTAADVARVLRGPRPFGVAKGARS